MSHTIQRLTMYALLISLERDCRDFISLYISPAMPDERVLDEQTLKKASERLLKDDPQAAVKLGSLIEYIDLGDGLSTIKRNEGVLDESTKKYIAQQWRHVEKMLPIRNRVMHARPLELDDFAIVIDTSQDLVRSNNALWPNLRTTIKELEANPSFVTTITIPKILDNTTDILHNLPQVDFDDTGFVGREKELAELKKAIFGSYPVITVIGEGGLGKTSIALKACYDLLDVDSKTFDAIVWTTSKASKLTLTEIEHIEGAITSSLGIIEHAATFLGRQNNTSPMEDMLLHLRHNKILLVIDNLETIIDNNIRNFVRNVPPGSKILFTTRIGLGAFDFPVQLAPLSKKEAIFYFRRTAKAWGVDDLAKAHNELVEDFIQRLQYNPLFIKWFIQGIRVGNRPASLANNLDLLLQFCLQNVFAGLPHDAQTIVRVLACIAGSQTIAGLVYFSDIESINVQSALAILLTSNLIAVERGRALEDEDRYLLSPLARIYIQKFLNPSVADQRKYIHKQNVLRSAEEEFSSRQGLDIFDVNFVFVRDKDDYIVAKFLTKVIDHVYKERYTEAEADLSLAMDLSPNYFEVKRVEAFLKQSQRNYFAAEAAYEAAVSLAPDQAPLRLWYGGFLSRDLGDHSRALEQIMKACELQPDAIPVKLENIRILQYQRNFPASSELIQTINLEAPMPPKHRRALYDLMIRSFTRQADDFASKDNYIETLAYLEKARSFANSIPSSMLDNTARKNIARASRLMPGLTNYFKGEAEYKRVCIIAEWLENPGKTDIQVEKWKGQSPVIQSDDTQKFPSLDGKLDDTRSRGRITRMHDSFAFVLSGRGDAFFGKHSWLGDFDFAVLDEGAIVEFNLVLEQKGLAAVKVLPVEVPALDNVRQGVKKGEISAKDSSGGIIRCADGNVYKFDRRACLPGTVFKQIFKGEQVRFLVVGDGGRSRVAAVESYSGA